MPPLGPLAAVASVTHRPASLGRKSLLGFVCVSMCPVCVMNPLPHMWELRHHIVPELWPGDHICGCGRSGKPDFLVKEVSLSKPAVQGCEETYNCPGCLSYLYGD